MRARAENLAARRQAERILRWLRVARRRFEDGKFGGLGRLVHAFLVARFGGDENPGVSILARTLVKTLIVVSGGQDSLVPPSVWASSTVNRSATSRLFARGHIGGRHCRCLRTDF